MALVPTRPTIQPVPVTLSVMVIPTLILPTAQAVLPRLVALCILRNLMVLPDALAS